MQVIQKLTKKQIKRAKAMIYYKYKLRIVFGLKMFEEDEFIKKQDIYDAQEAFCNLIN